MQYNQKQKTTPSTLKYTSTLTPESHNKYDYSSRFEVSFILDSGASNSLRNYPTYITIALILNVTCKNKTLKLSKSQSVSYQTVPILHCVTLTLNTTNEFYSRQFIITFAVVDTI